MALSKQDTQISTNLSPADLEAILQVLNKKKVRIVFEQSLDRGMKTEIIYKGKRYEIIEHLEVIRELYLMENGQRKPS